MIPRPQENLPVEPVDFMPKSTHLSPASAPLGEEVLNLIIAFA